MTQSSYPFDGTSTGDVAAGIYTAPYSSAEFSSVIHKRLASDSARGFVIPGYANNLAVTANSPAAMNVLVATGAAHIAGRFYETDTQETLTIGASDPANPRIDRIILRVSYAAQTIRLAVLAGTPAATPVLPTLTQNATTYEISLAYVWVAAAVASIAATEVHDERIFEANFESIIGATLQTNYLTNSEFMAFSRLDSSGSVEAGSPDGGWTLVGTVTTWANLTRPSHMSRGRAVRITAGAASSGKSQQIRVRASTIYAIKGLVQVTAGDVASIVVTTNSGAPGTITKSVRRTGAWLEYYIYYTTESDASTLTLSLLGLNNTDIVDFGQWIIVEGYVPGPFRQIHESIVFNFPLSDPDFDSDAFTTSGTTTIDLDSDYQAIILPGTRFIRIRAEIASNDTTAKAFEAGVVGSSFPIFRGGVYTAITHFLEGSVPIDVNNQCDFSRTVSAGTLTLGVYIIGITI